VIKNIKTATEFIDDYGYDWICHTSPDRSQWYSDGNTVHYQIFDQVPEYVLDTAKENFSLFSTSSILQWKKGDYVELKEGVPHRGSNSGKVPKYTAQITGIKK
jgi:hypothetical protein